MGPQFMKQNMWREKVLRARKAHWTLAVFDQPEKSTVWSFTRRRLPVQRFKDLDEVRPRHAMLPLLIEPDTMFKIPVQFKNQTSVTSGQKRLSPFTTMDSPTSSASSSPTLSPTSQAFSAFPFPPVPDHIIVTFDGKVREMVRITKDATEERKSRPKPKRYYSQDN